ncbi:hypothetical protein HD554DRAFT_2093510 [Boletus coccyginus]|nr:hypothetical protein HD554DRAFT_2093510 [Boletus coccyginus]
MAHDRSALWLTGQDESVGVNQCALIDKVLTRYSCEFTDDGRSSAAEIRFETTAYLRQKDGEQGSVAQDEDWTRLRKLAEGNPDEENVGPFGVGEWKHIFGQHVGGHTLD